MVTKKNAEDPKRHKVGGMENHAIINKKSFRSQWRENDRLLFITVNAASQCVVGRQVQVDGVVVGEIRDIKRTANYIQLHLAPLRGPEK